MLRVLLPKGAGTGQLSERNQLEIYAEDTRVDLVVARAIDPMSTKRRIREEGFQEMCHLVSDRAIPGTIYNVVIGLEANGKAFGVLISGDGRDIRLEMS